MIAKRIIPQFLLKGKRLVKGVRFSKFVDVGDPISQAVIYDAQGAEEIIIVDVEATQKNRIIDAQIIHQMITRCRLPISAGGGIKTIEHARECFEAGADKIILNTYAAKNPNLIRDFTKEFGSANVIAALDIKQNKNKIYEVFIHSGKENTHINVFELLEIYVKNGIGEVVITDITREGTMRGFDVDFYKAARKIVTVPLIASGGAGSYDDLVHVFYHSDVDAVALGKMLFLRDYDIIRIKAYMRDKGLPARDA